MRNRILGAIGLVWGVLVLLGGLGSDSVPGGNSAFQGGYTVGTYASLAFGAALAVAGLYYLVKGNGGGSRAKALSEGQGPDQASTDAKV
jgi:hypothetical protein